MSSHKYPALLVKVALLSTTVFFGACDDPEVVLPPSLETPRAMDVARGEVCLPPLHPEFGTIPRTALPRCAGDERGAIGLVVNEHIDQLAVVDMSRVEPRLVNLDQARPGVTHIPVGRSPVDVAASSDGTVAYVISQIERSLTPINIWVLRALDQSIELPGAPRKIAVRTDADANDQIVVALANPAQLWIQEGMSCAEPENVTDRLSYRAIRDCPLPRQDALTLPLPDAVADMDISTDGRQAIVIYRNLNFASVFAFEAAMLEDQDTSCIDGRVEAPCEISRIALAEDDAPLWGFSALSIDQFSHLAYVVDRANNQVLVIDVTRRELIDTAMATEPPSFPFTTQFGMGAVRAPLGVTADLQRTVLWQEGSRATIRYIHGAFVSSDTGAIYFMEAMTSFCELNDEAAPLTNRQFYGDRAALAASQERHCLHLPQFPLTDVVEPDDLEHRLFEREGVRLAVNPYFALRDARGASGRLALRASCQIPDDLLTSLQAAGGPTHCGSPLLAQPISTTIARDQDSFLESPRADLLQRRTLLMEPQDGTVETVVSEQPYDLRLRDETWTITYEGILPATQRSDRGVVAQDDGGVFQSGGLNLCDVGVHAGDRLTIVTRPGGDGEMPEGCEEFTSETDDATFRTFEISEVRRGELELAVIDDERFAQSLPTRECFNRGLRYHIRPTQEWTVVGERSGFVSDLESDGEACVERPGVEFGRTNARARTGEDFAGPYLEFHLREGAVEPLQDLRYSFVVQRNFSIDRLDRGPAGPSLQEPVLVMPTSLHHFRDLPQGNFLLATDPASNVLFIRNLLVANSRILIR